MTSPNVREEAEEIARSAWMRSGAEVDVEPYVGEVADAIESALQPLYRIADILKCDVSIVEEALEYALLAAEERGRREGLMAAANKLDKADYGPVYKMPGAVVPNALDYAARLVRALLPQPETQETK